MTRPPVLLSLSDYQQLTAAALNALLDAPRMAGALLEEIDRASVTPDNALPPTVARLGSWVEFVEGEKGGEVRCGRLVLGSAHPDGLSVLSPTGAALIGLRSGETILWPDRRGSEQRLTLLRVSNA